MMKSFLAHCVYGEESHLSIKDPKYTWIFEAAAMHFILEKVPRHFEAFVLRFGLSGEHPQTFKEIGKKLNLSATRIRQIVLQDCRFLRHPQFTSNLIFLFKKVHCKRIVCWECRRGCMEYFMIGDIFRAKTGELLEVKEFSRTEFNFQMRDPKTTERTKFHLSGPLEKLDDLVNAQKLERIDLETYVPTGLVETSKREHPAS